MDIQELNADRGERYGLFIKHAVLAQDIKDAMRSHKKWIDLAPDMKESLEMIANKIGRIINGDPNYLDSWIDIQGYAGLVATRLSGGKELRD